MPAQARLIAIAGKIAELAARSERDKSFAVELTPVGADAPTGCRISHWAVHQIWPLAGIPSLRHLNLTNSSVTDFSPLASMSLETIEAKPTLYNTSADDTFREMKTLKTIDGAPKADFLSGRAAHRKEIDDFAELAKNLPLTDVFPFVEKHIEKLNPKFPKPKMNTNGGGEVGQITFFKGSIFTSYAVELKDLAPFRVLPVKEIRLQYLNAPGCDWGLSDLSALRGTSVEKLRLTGCNVVDLGPIADVPLKSLRLTLVPLSDLRPIAKMKLQELELKTTNVKDFTVLDGMDSLKSINGMPVDEFKKQQAQEQK